MKSFYETSLKRLPLGLVNYISKKDQLYDASNKLYLEKGLVGEKPRSAPPFPIYSVKMEMWVLESELGVTTDYLFLTAWLSTQLLTVGYFSCFGVREIRTHSC